MVQKLCKSFVTVSPVLDHCTGTETTISAWRQKKRRLGVPPFLLFFAKHVLPGPSGLFFKTFVFASPRTCSSTYSDNWTPVYSENCGFRHKTNDDFHQVSLFSHKLPSRIPSQYYYFEDITSTDQFMQYNPLKVQSFSRTNYDKK